MPNEPTHYEVLGVTRDASPDEIHRAYLRSAREHHPDQQASVSADAQARAGEEMARVNEAWRVLGHPGRRRQYDRASPGGPIASGGPARTRDLDFDFRIDDGDDLLDVAPGRGHRLWTVLPWVLVFGVLGLIFVFTAYATGGGADDPGREAPGSRVGQCLLITSARPTIVEIDCAVSNDGQVVDEVPPGRRCPADTRQLDVTGEPNRLCLAG